jgi:hypothetical protein
LTSITYSCGGAHYFSSGAGVNAANQTVYAGAFTQSSDYRLKEEVTLLDDSWCIDALKPCSYTVKCDGKTVKQTGFLAHELQEVFPHLVTNEKDGDEMQSINYTGLIAILVKEIQNLKSEVLSLKGRL